jgi:hypothetical protein
MRSLSDIPLKYDSCNPRTYKEPPLPHSIPIEESLWHSLVALAKKKRKKPGSLAEQAVRDYLQRIEDEELLDQSERQAQKTGISPSKAESLIRQRRNRARS